MSKFLNKNNLLSVDQFGFRQGRSTVDAVVGLVDLIVEGLENHKSTLGVFLDLSKAFDCVDHNTLLQRVESHGIRGVPLDWVKSFLRGRSQSVQISNKISKSQTLRYGVPQGSILSPLLFLIYVNDVGSSLENGRIVQYADDTTLCFREPTSKILEIETFVNLNSCIQHFEDLNLKTNASKSSFIKFCLRERQTEIFPTVMVEETEVEMVSCTKFLGIYLDKGLTWEDHVNNICRRVSSGIYVLRYLSRFCPTQVLLMAYYGLIHPHLTYGIVVWGGCASKHFIRLFRLQKKAVRILAHLRHRESCRGAFKQFGLLTLPCLYILETSTFFLSKCVQTQGHDIHSYATRGRENYRTGRHRTVVHERLPSQAGVHFVNKLPPTIDKKANPNLLKIRLKRLLVSEAFYSVGEYLSHSWE